MSDQSPPADELAAIRAQLRALSEREAELRNLMLTDPTARTGNRYAVELREVESRRTDLTELRAAYPALVDEHTYPVKTMRVELRAISEDGEITRIARKAD